MKRYSDAAKSVNCAQVSHFIGQEERTIEAHIPSTASVTTPKTAILVANPTSGSYVHHATQIADTVLFLRQHGWQAVLHLTREAGDAGRLARGEPEGRCWC